MRLTSILNDNYLYSNIVALFRFVIILLKNRYKSYRKHKG